MYKVYILQSKEDPKKFMLA